MKTLACFVFGTALCWCAVLGADEAHLQDQELVKKILQLPKNHITRLSPDFDEIVAGKDLRRLLLDNWRVPEPQDRVRLLLILREEVLRSEGIWRVYDVELARALVDALDDENMDVRHFAAESLNRYFDLTLIRFFSDAILTSVRKNPSSDGILLAGKTGSKEAVELLTQDMFRNWMDKKPVELALAKLGDHKLEAKFVDEFAKCQDERKVADDLAYIGTMDACRAIAAELRSPVIIGVPWRQSSIRVFLIESLSHAFPGEKVLRPPNGPIDDTYYEAIEKWATAVLGVTWDVPRPKFFYAFVGPSPREADESQRNGPLPLPATPLRRTEKLKKQNVM